MFAERTASDPQTAGEYAVGEGRGFFADFAEKAKPEGGFLAILEVCGMNPWLLKMLEEYGCREIIVTQPTERSKQKTDRRDAGILGHLLWVHRQQFLEGKHPLGVRRIQPPTSQEADDRQITALRARLTKNARPCSTASTRFCENTTWSRHARPRSSRRKKFVAG